jgi:hypothetical protein
MKFKTFRKVVTVVGVSVGFMLWFINYAVDIRNDIRLKVKDFKRVKFIRKHF